MLLNAISLSMNMYLCFADYCDFGYNRSFTNLGSLPNKGFWVTHSPSITSCVTTEDTTLEKQVKFAQKLAVAAAGTALSLAAMEATSVHPALAATITYDFTLNVTSGSLAGIQGSGFFSYDDSTLTGIGLETLGDSEELSISFDFLGKAYNETDDTDFPDFPLVQFQDSSLLGLSFFTAKNDEFRFQIENSAPNPDVLGGNEFTFSSPRDIEGSGVVNYSLRPVPEPGTVSGVVLLGLGGLLLKRLSSQRE